MQASDAHERADRRAEGHPRGAVLHASSIISRPLSSPSRRDGTSRRQESGRSPRDAHTPDRAAGASSRAARCACGARSRASRSRAPPLARWSRSTRHSTMARPTETGAAAMRSTRSSTRSARGRGCVWFSMLRVVFEARPGGSCRFLFFMSSSMLSRGGSCRFSVLRFFVSQYLGREGRVVYFVRRGLLLVFRFPSSSSSIPQLVSCLGACRRRSIRLSIVLPTARAPPPPLHEPDDRGATAPTTAAPPPTNHHLPMEALMADKKQTLADLFEWLGHPEVFCLLPSIFCLWSSVSARSLPARGSVCACARAPIESHARVL